MNKLALFSAVLLVAFSNVGSSCPKTIIENKTLFLWNRHDQETMDHAKKRCGEVYPDAPCLKKFIKYDEQDYSAICGY